MNLWLAMKRPKQCLKCLLSQLALDLTNTVIKPQSDKLTTSVMPVATIGIIATKFRSYRQSELSSEIPVEHQNPTVDSTSDSKSENETNVADNVGSLARQTVT